MCVEVLGEGTPDGGVADRAVRDRAWDAEMPRRRRPQPPRRRNAAIRDGWTAVPCRRGWPCRREGCHGRSPSRPAQERTATTSALRSGRWQLSNERVSYARRKRPGSRPGRGVDSAHQRIGQPGEGLQL